MKTIYSAIIARLQQSVPQLKWIDLDTGQLDVRQAKPGVLFPCALIGISVRVRNNITDTVQDCDATVTLRLAFEQHTGRSSAQAPEQARESSLAMYDTIADVHAALQGFETANFEALHRTAQSKETGPNGLFQYKIEYKTSFEDNP